MIDWTSSPASSSTSARARRVCSYPVMVPAFLHGESVQRGRARVASRASQGTVLSSGWDGTRDATGRSRGTQRDAAAVTVRHLRRPARRSGEDGGRPAMPAPGPPAAQRPVPRRTSLLPGCDSLAEALDALGRQAGTGRLVAVISHLRSVAEAMDRAWQSPGSPGGRQVRWLGGRQAR